jgi:hypothetical protein
MRRLIWAILFLGAYFWLVTSGNDALVLEKGKAVYEAIVAWLDGADIDYQTKRDKDVVKRHRRWD